MPKRTPHQAPGKLALPESRRGNSRPAILRVFEIHCSVRSGRYPNCRTLAREIEVTPKTIQRDISFMRDQLGLPLEFHPIKNGYHYTEEVHDFPLLHLSKTDLVALFLARHALEPIRGTKLEQMLTESFSKIAEACAGEISIEWTALDEAFSVKTAGVLAADVTLFGDLLDAVRGRREVRFDYHKLTGLKPESRTVHPYHVGQIEHGWYVVAYDPARDGMRTFALQRIQNLELLKTKFTRNPNFNARDHLGGGFGVWSYSATDGTPQEVRIIFEDYAARIIAERVWHPTQRVKVLKEDGSKIEFQATLRGLEEITRWVLSWGSKARVLEPQELGDRVRLELQAMAQNHSG